MCCDLFTGISSFRSYKETCNIYLCCNYYRFIEIDKYYKCYNNILFNFQPKEKRIRILGDLVQFHTLLIVHQQRVDNIDVPLSVLPCFGCT